MGYDTDSPEPRFSLAMVVRIAVVALLLLVAGWWFSPTIMRMVIVHDLREYATAIRRSDLDLESKVRVLDQIDSLEDRLQKGRSFGIMQWRFIDTTISELLDGEISSDDLRLVERELTWARKRMEAGK
jgi:hypothetical protein